MVKDVISGFEGVVESAKNLEREFERLSKMEARCVELLAHRKEAIKGLEKSLSFSSITREAIKEIDERIENCKHQANQLLYILGETNLS